MRAERSAFHALAEPTRFELSTVAVERACHRSACAETYDYGPARVAAFAGGADARDVGATISIEVAAYARGAELTCLSPSRVTLR
jgi:hypothetical protein